MGKKIGDDEDQVRPYWKFISSARGIKTTQAKKDAVDMPRPLFDVSPDRVYFEGHPQKGRLSAVGINVYGVHSIFLLSEFSRYRLRPQSHGRKVKLAIYRLIGVP